MNENRIRAAFRGAVLLASASCGASAWAQTVDYATPRATIDENGVDISTGKFIVTGASVAIGGSNGLAWSQGRGNILKTRFYTQVTNGVTEYVATIGDDPVIFVKTGSTFTPRERIGATLRFVNNSYIYTSDEGDELTFVSPGYYQILGYYGSGYIPSQLRRSNGDTLSFYYDQVSLRASSFQTLYYQRLSYITTSSGYAMQVRHASNYIPPNSSQRPPIGWEYSVGVALGDAGSCAYEYRSGSSTSCTALRMSWPQATDGQWSVTDAAGRVTTATASGIRLPGSTSDDVSVAYANNRVSAVTAAGVTTNYTFADTPTTRTATVTRGSLPARVTVFRLPSLQVLSEQWNTDPSGPTYTRGYDYSPDANDPDGTLLKQITEPEGNHIRFSYDPRGNVTQTRLVSKTQGTPPDIVTSASYDATCANAVTCNQPNTTTDARGGVTSYAYDPVHGGILNVTGPAPDPAQPAVRPRTDYSYAQFGSSGTASTTGTWMPTGATACATATTCAGGANERRATIGYGYGLNVTSVTQAAGDNSVSATTTATYDALGNTVAVDGPMPGSDDAVRMRYDVLRRPTGTTGPDPDGGGALLPRATRTTYNVDGTVQTLEQGTDTTPAATDFNGFISLQQVTSSYDGYHRKVKDVLTSGGQTWAVGQQSYDALSRLDCAVIRMDPGQWPNQPDACSPQTTGPNGPDRVARRSYDAGGRLSAVTTAYGTAATSTETTGYTIAGQTATVADANGNTTAYAYDGFGRPWRTCFQTASSAACAGGPGDYEQTSYAPNGDVSGVRLRDGREVMFGYDGMGRRKTTTFANPVDLTDSNVSYAYDLMSRLTLAQDGNGHQAGYAYDALGRVTTETGTWGSLSSLYDAAGRRTRLTWNDGFFVNYGYDATGAMTTIIENTGLLLATYEYDDLGRRTRRLLGNGTSTTYGFDAASRLTALNLNGGGQPNATTFAWNPAGQIASRTTSNDAYAWTGATNVDRAYTANGLNQYTASGSVVPTYDARGNLTSAGGASWLYNSKNQLSGANGTYLYYDPAGRLDQVTQSGLAWEWDGSALVTERSGGAIVKRYVHGAGVDEPILWYEGSGTGDRRWLDADERGSIVRVTNDAGTALAVNSYDEFGIPGANNLGRFQYTGQMWMPELGFYHYKARMYSPTLGRFLQTEPIGYGDGLNWYDYVGGDPVNNTDPSGLALYRGTWRCPQGYEPGAPGSCRRPGSSSGSGGSNPAITLTGYGTPFPATLDCGGNGFTSDEWGMCDDLKSLPSTMPGGFSPTPRGSASLVESSLQQSKSKIRNSTCEAIKTVGDFLLDTGQKSTSLGVDVGVGSLLAAPFTEGASLAGLVPAGALMEIGGGFTLAGDIVNSAATGNFGPLIWNQFGNMAKGALNSQSAKTLGEIAGMPLDSYMGDYNPYRCG